RLLAVPSLRERYLEKVRTIATEDLDWKNIGPVVTSWRELIGPSVAEETRGLASFEQFQRATADEPAAEGGEGGGFGRGAIPLRAFADQRRAYLLSVLEKNDGDPAEGE